MSKSLGNFHTVHEVLETEKVGGRKWPGEVVRLAMLMTHYREPIDFSVKRLEEAENIHRKLARRARQLEEAGARPGLPTIIADALSDDLNTPAALHELQRLASGDADNDAVPEQFLAGLEILGIKTGQSDARQDVHQIEAQIARRLELIRERNWSEADRIRDELLSQGIQLNDSKDSETGERITIWEVT